MDKEVFDIINKEEKRQESTIDLIASENYTSKAVRDAVGSVMTNKYAEGYVSKRYYAGCQFIDEMEQLAIDRGIQLFGAEHINVQPYSGSTANMAVYFSVLKPGDCILGMTLSHGGHLTHGSAPSFSGQLFTAVNYGVNIESGYIDYDEVRELAKKHKPKMIVCGHSAYSRIINFYKFKEIAEEVGAYLLADISHISGLVAAGYHPSPVGIADFITTTTHKTLRGPRGAIIMCNENMAKSIDKSVFPFLQGGPFEHVIAGKAVAFGEALTENFRKYQRQIINNAKALAVSLRDKGYDIVSGGTENHVMIIDLTRQGVTGKDSSVALEKAGIITSKATIPGETLSPFITSGIRLGTPAVTTRGMKENEMKTVSQLFNKALKNISNENILNEIKNEVEELAKQFPIPESFAG